MSEPTKTLSDRQLEFVMHLANGKRIHEICKMYDLSESSVNKSISRAKENCGARTTVQLVSLLIHQERLWWNPKDNQRSMEKPEWIDPSNYLDAPQGFD